jgi:hypothetical protein
MPSVDDVYNQLTAANTKLDQIKSELVNVKNSEDAVKSSVDNLNSTVQNGLNQLIALETYGDEALYQITLQNHTIICLLKQISIHTCGIWNEIHIDTGLQTTIRDDTEKIATLVAASNATAALTWEHEQALKKQIEACCPPEQEPSVCEDRPCPEPKEIPKPPTPKRQPGTDIK